ncbi:MAG TPA: hypothetical protein VLX44_03245 [Xanthobacteraceae bacterium]|nr:hypothetical protein [Xanthobacteraceae bacterium]
MESYPVDIDPAQLLRWLKAENEAAPETFRITAGRSQERRALAAGNEAHLGDEEREDLSEIATVATLEIAPAYAHEGWLLKVMVEDELGPQLADGSADGEQAIDLGTFYSEYIRSGRGIANIVAEVEGPAARHHVNRLLATIEKNRHVPGADKRQPRKAPRSPR